MKMKMEMDIVRGAAVLVLLAITYAEATTYTFNETANTVWANQNNWIPSTSYPRNTDDTAIIPSSNPYIVVSLGSVISVGSLTLGSNSPPSNARAVLNLDNALGVINTFLSYPNTTINISSSAGK
jgi:hypothetical protein